MKRYYEILDVNCNMQAGKYADVEWIFSIVPGAGLHSTLGRTSIRTRIDSLQRKDNSIS